MKKLLAVFAHPDDESFGPGGTLAKYAHEGVEIHILTATRGEAGQWQIKRIKNPIRQAQGGHELSPASAGSRKRREIKNENPLHHIREKELIASAKILGIKKVEFLDFVDGNLGNAIYHDLAKKIITKINSFRPQVILTFDQQGVSGHIDHIAVSMITTYSYLKTNLPQKLYYYCLSEIQRRKEADDYFIYFPDGLPESRITTMIDYTEFFQIKKKAMYKHQSQLSDVKKILGHLKKLPKVENFILQYHRKVKVSLPEFDLFSGIDA